MTQSFSAQLDEYIKRRKLDAEKTFRASCLNIAEKVITRTPVDTGRARGNWNADIGQFDSSTNSATPDEGSGIQAPNASPASREAMSRVKQKVSALRVGQTFTLTNGLPYIRSLEYGLYGDGPKTTGGYSRQAPQGMLRVTAEEFQQAVREALNNV